jgi:hypothetical protein
MGRMGFAASMDAMRLLNPRLLRQAGPARGYLAVTVALGLAGAVLILFQADLLSRALAGAARGTGIAAVRCAGLARRGWPGVLAATAGRTMLLITHDLDGLDEFDQVITLEGGKIADVYLLRDPGSGSSATRYPSRLRGAQCIPAGGPDRAARFT